jgi:hypothetical protein
LLDGNLAEATFIGIFAGKERDGFNHVDIRATDTSWSERDSIGIYILKKNRGTEDYNKISPNICSAALLGSYGQTKSSYQIEIERRLIEARTKTYSESQQKQALNGYTADQYVYARRLNGLSYDKAMEEVFRAYVYYEDKRTGRTSTKDLTIKLMEHEASRLKQIDQANIKENEVFFNKFSELLLLYKKLGITDLGITFRFYNYLIGSSTGIAGRSVNKININAFKNNNWLGIKTSDISNSENAFSTDSKGYYVYSTLENFLKDVVKLELKKDVSLTKGDSNEKFYDLTYMHKYWEFYNYDKTSQGPMSFFDHRTLPILPGHRELKKNRR